MKKCTLYALGTGPGAPDLLTLRAVAVLKKVDVILAASSSGKEYSTALNVIRPHLPEHTPVVKLDFPMTRNREILAQAWDNATSITLSWLNKNLDAAFITIGDPLIYSTFGYLMRSIQKIAPETRIEIVPGITSFQAAAAKKAIILCEGDQSLHIISGLNSFSSLCRLLDNRDTVIILKAYRNFPEIIKALEHTGRLSASLLATHVERAEEKFTQLKADNATPDSYMSLIISPHAKGQDNGI